MPAASLIKRKKNRTELRSESTRQSLISAAKEMFAERGLDITTIDDITACANVGKGTFYLHFANKSELINLLITSVMSELCSAVDSACKNSKDLKEILDGMIAAHLKFFSERKNDFVLFFQGRSDLSIKQSYEGIDEPITKYLEHMGDTIAAAVKPGMDRDARIQIACAVAGYLSGYFSFAMMTNSGHTPEDTFNPVKKALASSLMQFIKETAPAEAGCI